MTKKKYMLSALVKEARIARGYTQKELSEHTHISVRSIQRIENGQITPRQYTVKVLAQFLGFSPEHTEKTAESAQPWQHIVPRIILSFGLALSIVVLTLAYVSQSATFPETHFEGLLLFALVTLTITGILTIIWRTR